MADISSDSENQHINGGGIDSICFRYKQRRRAFGFEFNMGFHIMRLCHIEGQHGK